MKISKNKNEFYLAKWMADELSDTDFKKNVSEKDFLAYKKLKKGINLYEKLESPLNENYKQLINTINRRKKQKVKSLYYKWAMSIAALAILFFSFQIFFSNQMVTNKTDFGQQKTITLLDGSEVILQAKSQIKYNKSKWKSDEREILLDGEAFFKVKKGSTFKVKTKNGLVEVLGTQFNVNSYKEFFEVICYTGKVKVTNKNKDYILLPTKGFRKIDNKVENLLSDSKKPTWLNGIKTYRSIPIKYVISDMENQFNVIIDDSKINKNVLFTGSFNIKNKALAYVTVFKAMNINYTLTNKNNVKLMQND
jgi:ferric-dicitrate binding protein FerR (iron transport regulator)